MKKSPILGYIVYHVGGTGEGSPVALGIEGGYPKVLWLSDHTTLFKSRKTAEKAIERTIQFEKDHDYDWTKMYGPMKIMPVRS